MCGIVGILGDHEVGPLLVNALKRLEYRGYDSAGIATLNDGKLGRRRSLGKLAELSDLLVRDPIQGKSGIGHTRWATHGKPSVNNAHPHMTEQVAVVHNGIIENFQELRKYLEKKGIKHTTDTDTETIALLTQAMIEEGNEPIEAAQKTIEKLTGAFALCFLFQGQNDLMIAARKGSPLAIGYGKGEMFVGSDAIALSPMTNKISYLDEGDFAVLTRKTVDIWDQSKNSVKREIKEINTENAQIQKDGYQHFMEKEIHEQPRVISLALEYYFDQKTGKVTLPDNLNLNFNDFEQISLVACGTAFYACHVAKYWFEEIARIPVEIDIASEFRYREPPIKGNTLAIFVSQSGETADTLAALRYCSGKAKKILSITNVVESSISRESDHSLPILAGVEIGVASTKAFTCQLSVLFALSIKAAADLQKISEKEQKNIYSHFLKIPSMINQILGKKDKFIALANKLSEARDILFLGRGLVYPLALEGSLKLKEISYIHAEAYASGELKHGPIALIDKSVPVIILAPKDKLFDKNISNVQEVAARGGKVVLLSDKSGFENTDEEFWSTIEVPKTIDTLNPLLYAVAVQLIAYYTAVAKGTDVDQPRNLAKSVTVE